MPATRSRQSPLNPPLSHTPQKWRQPEDTIPEDSDPVPPGGDVTFTSINLPNSGPSNPFTPKGKERRPPALQGDGGDGRDSDSLDDGDPNGGNVNDNDDDDDEVDDHLNDVDKQVPA